MANGHILLRFVCFTIALCIFTGCSALRPVTSPVQDKEAFFLANQAKSFNQDILASKGIARVRMVSKNKVDTFKIAWAASFPNKIRLTLLSSGHPIETILSTGEKITFISHTGGHAKHSFTSKDPDMKRYLKVPIKMSEMILVLLGRFPVKNFDDAYFPSLDTYPLPIALKEKWKGTQYLFLDDKGKIKKIQSLDYAGKFLYEMTIFKYKSYEGRNNVPAKILIKDTDKRNLSFEIINFKANPSIKESVFQLTE